LFDPELMVRESTGPARVMKTAPVKKVVAKKVAAKKVLAKRKG
jgi:hypothetical protein